MTEAVQALAGAALDRRLDRRSPAPLAVAVSGGGDSVALLHLAAAWAAEAGRRLLVLTVDHGLAPDAAAWARLVSERAAGLGLDSRVLHWTGPKPASGLPAAARSARHALLGEAARAAGARVLLMGHTADDIFESERMRAEGSSVGEPQEWAPSPAWPEGRGVFVLRPLLALAREDLRAFLRGRGECWIEDPANADLRFARARARAAGGPRGCATDLRLRPASPPRGEGTGWGGLALSTAEARDLPLLSAALVCASGASRPARGVRLARLAERLAAGGGTLAGARAVPDGAKVLIGRDPGRAGPPTLRAEPGTEAVWDGRFAVTLRERGAIGPLAGRSARLGKAERASLKAVPAWARPPLPVLETYSGAVRLLSEARPLALQRLRAACGVYANEADLTAV